MGFSFKLEDFLNGFSAGFLFICGISITNGKYAKEILSYLQDTIGDAYVVLGLIAIYITGLVIVAVDAFLSTLSTDMKEFIDEHPKARVLLPLKFLYKIALYIPISRWGVTGTFCRYVDKQKLPPKIRHLNTYTEFLTLINKIEENSKNFSWEDFYKAQFFLTCADSVIFVLIFDFILFIFNKYDSSFIPIVNLALICIPVFFMFKAFSSVFARWFFRGVARNAAALDIIK